MPSNPAPAPTAAEPHPLERLLYRYAGACADVDYAAEYGDRASIARTKERRDRILAEFRAALASAEPERGADGIVGELRERAAETIGADCALFEDAAAEILRLRKSERETATLTERLAMQTRRLRTLCEQMSGGSLLDQTFAEICAKLDHDAARRAAAGGGE